jgi:hypothetical protein
MPSPAAITAAQGTRIELVWFYLVSISTPGNPTLYLVNNNEPVTSRGNVYQPFPMDMKLPQEDSDTLPSVEITFFNLANEIVEAIREFRRPPDITIELVTNITPDVVERTIDFAVLRNVTYDAISISGRLDLQNVLTSAIPSEAYTPQRFPGLFVT